MAAGGSIHSNLRRKRAFLPQQQPRKPQAEAHWDDLGYISFSHQSLSFGARHETS